NGVEKPIEKDDGTKDEGDTKQDASALPPPTLGVLKAASAVLEEVAADPTSLSSKPAVAVPDKSTDVEATKDQKINPMRSNKVIRTHARAQSTSVGPNDVLGEGDSRIVYNLLSGELAAGVFEKLRDEVKWQTMYHRGGE